MILDAKGQTLQFNGKTFTVGGAVLQLCKEFPAPLGTILSINTGDMVMAQCGYEDQDTEFLPLEQLVPVSAAVPTEKGRQYALYVYFDGSEGQKIDVLGVSSDKSVLARLMLDDVENDESISAMMTYSAEDSKEDALYFYYENANEIADPFYLEYAIKPVPVYPECGNDRSVDPSDK